MASLLLAALALGAAAAPSIAWPQQVWTASSVEKIRPSVAARSSPSAAISAARNEYEAFQVVVTGPATGVKATASDFTGPGTVARPALYREALINLTNASALDGGTGRYPDALVPDVDAFVGEKRNAFPFDVPAGESRAIWVEVKVPSDAKPGAYTGTVQVTWTGGSANVPVSLTVWPFTLPDTASLKSAFSFAWGAIPSEHGMSAGDAYSKLRVRYGQLALMNRVTLSHVDDGNAALTHVDQYYGSSLDGTDPLVGGAKMTSFELMGPASSWSSYFKTKGWSDRLFQYTCDEPPLTCAWSDIPVRAKAAHDADPNLRTLVTTTIQEADEKGVTSSIDVMVPVINYLEDKPNASRFSGDQRAKYDAFLKASPRRELWVYQSCMSHGCGGTVNFGSPSYSDQYFTGWPSYMIDASAVRNRAMQWLAFRFNASGELYFETAMAYGHDPWTNQWDFSGNGDGTLFYPGTPAKIGGTTHIPVGSIRLALIREGMEDYEYLKLLSDLGDEAGAKAVAAKLFPHAYQTEAAPADVLAARQELAQRILSIVAPGTSPGPTPTPDPTPTPGPTPSPDPTPSRDPAPEQGGETPTSSVAKGGCNAAGSAGALALLGLLGAVRRRRRS